MSEIETPRRRSTRLKDYDYSLSGAYFVTIVTQNRSCVFGDVDAEEMKLNPAGEMVDQIWHSLPSRFPSVIPDAFIVMPNHVHGVLVINQPINPHSPAEPHAVPKLGGIISAFKSKTTVEYTRGVNQHGWPPFPRRLWQRNYYDRIIRNERELTLIRRYIAENPLKWHLDRENPDNVPHP